MREIIKYRGLWMTPDGVLHPTEGAATQHERATRGLPPIAKSLGRANIAYQPFQQPRNIVAATGAVTKLAEGKADGTHKRKGNAVMGGTSPRWSAMQGYDRTLRGLAARGW